MLDENGSSNNDKLTRNYDTILTESALLITFSAIIFGFLLNASIRIHGKSDIIDMATLIISLSSITTAAVLFVMPVIYHHLEYPYRDLGKFKIRSHRFILLGLIPTGLTIYLCIALGLRSVVPFPGTFILALPPFVLSYFLFRARKHLI